MNTYKKVIVGLAICSLALTMTACGKKSSGPSFKAGVAAELVTEEGTAWLDIGFGTGQSEGFTFAATGEYQFISDVTGEWTVSGEGLVEANKGIIKTNQGQLYYAFEEGLEAKYELAPTGILTLTSYEGKDVFLSVSFVKTAIGEITGPTPTNLIKGR